MAINRQASRNHATYVPPIVQPPRTRRAHGTAAPAATRPRVHRPAPPHAARSRSRADREASWPRVLAVEAMLLGLLGMILAALIVYIPAMLRQVFLNSLAARAFPFLLAGVMLILLRGVIGRAWYWTMRHRVRARSRADEMRDVMLLCHGVVFVLLTAIMATLIAAGAAAAVDVLLAW